MPAPTDPERYSIDEMMERLRSRPEEDPLQQGELVTRADGSQAIRVRKRKRRSHQPHKEELKRNRRARMVQISGVLLLLILAAITAGSAIVYANSAPFREGLLRKIRECSGAAAEISAFRVTPTQANASRLQLKWPDGNVLNELQVIGVSANIAPGSFLGKALTGEEANGSQAILSLRSPTAGTARSSGKLGDGQPPSIRFNRYAVPKLQINIGDAARPMLVLRDCEASFQPLHATGRPQLLLNRGNIFIHGWPGIRLDRAHIEFRGNDVDIVGLRLLHESDSRGLFELDGSFSPYAGDRPASLNVRLESFQLFGLTGPDLGGLISGRIDSVSTPKSNELAFTPGADPAPSLTVTFRSSLTSAIEMQRLPVFSHLARLLEDTWFERPVFDVESTGTLQRTNSGITLNELDLQQKTRLAIRGTLTMNLNRQLSGNIRIGVNEAMVKAAGNRRLATLLAENVDGYCWTPITLSGSANAPQDDFLKRYDAVPKTNPAATRPDAQAPTFEDLTRPQSGE